MLYAISIMLHVCFVFQCFNDKTDGAAQLLMNRINYLRVCNDVIMWGVKFCAYIHN